MNARPSTAATAALGLLLVAADGNAAETRTSYGVAVLAGFDSNPLLVAGDGPSGVHGQLRLQGSVTRFVGAGSTAAWFADGRVASRLEGSGTADAGHDSGDVRAGFALTPPVAGQRLVVSAGGRLSAYRGTFTDRFTGEVYRASVAPPTDPPSTTPIPDRLDFDATGAFLNLRWRQGDRFSFHTSTSFDRTRFVEDYRASTDLDSLDYRSLTVRPGVSVDLGRNASLDLYVARTDLEYDDRPALDANGAPVPGTSRAYDTTQLGLALKLPAGRWKLDVGLAGAGSDDTHAGYYDSTNAFGLIGVDRELSQRSALRVYASLREVDYDRATVTGDPADTDLLGTRERRYAARFTRSFAERLSWHVEAGTQDTDSQDRLFAYERDWVHTGIHFGR